MENKFVYLHITKDTNEVFYVGIGNKVRAKVKFGRNKYWSHIAKKHGYFIQIVKENISIDEACKIEKELILNYKKLNLARCNMTEGGDSHFGFRHSEEIKEKIRKAQIGGNNSRALKVIDISTNKIYNTIKEAAEDLKISKSHLGEKLKGLAKNNTNIRYLTGS